MYKKHIRSQNSNTLLNSRIKYKGEKQWEREMKEK